jgi:glycerol kinase
VGLNVGQVVPPCRGLGHDTAVLDPRDRPGTTGTTCIVFDERGGIAGRAYREFEQHFPRPGWVEHDAAEIWDVTQAVAKQALDAAGIDGRGLAGIGITNQRETVVAWDRDSGKPLHRAIVWQDRRTAARCDELKEQGHEPRFREATGLVLDPYFSGTKIEWLITDGDVDPGAALGRSTPGWCSSSPAGT